MSLFLSKLLAQLTHPLFVGLLLVGLGGVVAWWWRHWGVSAVALGVLVIWIPATPLVSDGLRARLERQFPPTPIAAVPAADAIVTLGGAIGAPQPPRVHPDLSGAADRVWHAARLYRAGKAPLIIASGGTLPWRDQQFREADAMKTLLRRWGVPADSVLTESQSASTYQNATNTAALVDRRGLDRVLLVTSALHMRRALATFRSAGVVAVPAATDYRVVDQPISLLDLVPNSGALRASTAAIHEYVGYWVYEWRGWITDRPDPGGRRSSQRPAPLRPRRQSAPHRPLPDPSRRIRSVSRSLTPPT